MISRPCTICGWPESAVMWRGVPVCFGCRDDEREKARKARGGR
jgi:hypothetical protein